MLPIVRRWVPFTAWTMVAAFVIWTAGSVFFSGAHSQSPGKLFNRPVSSRIYQESLAATSRTALLLTGVVPDLEGQQQIEDMAWSRLIYLQEARRRRISVNDTEVAQTIGSIPYFQTEGRFDAQKYDRFVRQVMRTSPRQFEEEFRQSLTIGKLRRLISDQFRPSDAALRQMWERDHEQRNIAYLEFPWEARMDGTPASPQAVSKFYRDNPELFTRERSIAIRYALSPLRSADELSPPDTLVAFARELDSKIEDPAQLAEQHGLAFATTDLFDIPLEVPGLVPGLGKADELIRRAQEMPIHRWSGPTPTPKGWVVFQIVENRQGWKPPLEDIQEEAADRYLESHARESARQHALSARDRLISYRSQHPSAPLGEAAREAGTHTQQTDLFDRLHPPYSLAVSPSVWVAIFLQPPGEISQPVATEKGWVLLEVLEIRPADPAEFDQQTSEQREKLKADATAAAYQQWQRDLFTQAGRTDLI